MTAVDTHLNTKVQSLLQEQIAAGRQLGTQVAAYRYGKPIVNAWAGEMGPNDPRPVRPERPRIVTRWPRPLAGAFILGFTRPGRPCPADL